MSNLKKLICEYCYSLKDDNIISLLRCAIKLEVLNVFGCISLTNSFTDVAVEIEKIEKIMMLH